MASELVKELNEANFDTEVAADIPVLVDFWAPWCGPCRMLAPTIDKIAAEIGDATKVCKVNVDEAPEIAARFGIMSIPTLLVFREGKLVGQMVGVQSAETILKVLQ